jgi:hypothetical protein
VEEERQRLGVEIGPRRRRLTPGRTAGEGSGEREDGGGRRLRRAGGLAACEGSGERGVAPLWCRGETNCGGGRRERSEPLRVPVQEQEGGTGHIIWEESLAQPE